MSIERLKVVLYNAITVLLDDGRSATEICVELGMSEQEFKEVMYID